MDFLPFVSFAGNRTVKYFNYLLVHRYTTYIESFLAISTINKLCWKSVSTFCRLLYRFFDIIRALTQEVRFTVHTPLYHVFLNSLDLMMYKMDVWLFGDVSKVLGLEYLAMIKLTMDILSYTLNPFKTAQPIFPDNTLSWLWEWWHCVCSTNIYLNTKRFFAILTLGCVD